jgi:lysophospholipase L1-like esterase
MRAFVLTGCAAGLVGALLPGALLGGEAAMGAQPATSPAPGTNHATAAVARTDGGWVQRNAAFNARAKVGHEKGDIGVIFIGDSITQGWEENGKGVWAASYEKRHAVNFGIGGDRTEHVLWRVEHGNLDGLAKPEKGSAPKLVVLMIGTNNTGSDSAEDIAEGIGADVHAIREKLPETPVLLLGVFPRGQKADDPLRAKIAEINRRAEKLADGKRVVFLDFGSKLVEKDGTISAEIMPDFLHLSAKGYQIWADAIEAKVKEMMGEK